MALKLVTIWSAFSMFSDSQTGNLKEGKYADFVVLEKDYTEGPDEEIHNNKAIMTFINGELVWADKSAPVQVEAPVAQNN